MGRNAQSCKYYDDGVLEVVIVGDVGLGFFTRYQGALYRGEHPDLSQIRHLRGKVIRVEVLSDDPVLAELDGEDGARLPATFEVLPSAIRVHA